MKFLFASLICHRDVEIFKFNWFCMRAQLDHGFDIPHLLLNDGSLTEEDKKALRELPLVILEEEPIQRLPVPKDVLLGKLECLKRGFEKHNVDRVIVFDCDIFFLRNWEADLRKILTERVVVLRDWGSSLGPNVDLYKQLFGVHEDATTPNCNTGIISVKKEDYHLIDEKLNLHIKNPFQCMEDQGIMFAAFYKQLSYVNGIKCLINGAEYHAPLWSWVLKQNAAHLMGMRVRPDGLNSLIATSLNNLPESMHLSQIDPTFKYISWGILSYDHLNFTAPLQQIPSTVGGTYISDALYLHGGSTVKWALASRFMQFTTKVVCMDTGIPANIQYVIINDRKFHVGDEIRIPLKGSLLIETLDGPGTHIAFLEPRLLIDKSWPDTSLQKE